MAVADLFKLSSESSLRSSSTSTTTHVVGLLSVLAISGSVALFTLGGRLKLTAEMAVASSDAPEPLKTEGDASEPLKMDGRDGLMGEGEEASEPLNMNSCRDGRQRRVRFADDVVEPRGNGREYRRRFAQRQHEEGVGASKRHPIGNSIPANRMALYKGLRQYRLQHSASFFS